MQPIKAQPMERHMTDKTFNKRSNAQRAARSTLKNPKAVEGSDFVTFKSGDDWAFRVPGVMKPEAPVVEPAKKRDTGARGETKVGAAIEAAKAAGGVSNTQLRSITGWAKLGGFFTACKRANIKLERVRKDGDTFWSVAA